MADYRLENLSLSTRFELAVGMLDPFRRWGLVSELAREKAVSRKFVYGIQDKARAAILKGLEARRPGRKGNTNQVEVDDQFVDRAIAILVSVVPGAIRPVQ